MNTENGKESLDLQNEATLPEAETTPAAAETIAPTETAQAPVQSAAIEAPQPQIKQAEAPADEAVAEKPATEMYDCFYVEVERSEERKLAKLVSLKRTVPLTAKEAEAFNKQFNTTGYHGEIYLPAGVYKVGQTEKI